MKLAENVLFSRSNKIRRVDLDNPYYHIIPPISLPQGLQAVQLDFYGHERRIFWVDALSTGLMSPIMDPVWNDPSHDLNNR